MSDLAGILPKDRFSLDVAQCLVKVGVTFAVCSFSVFVIGWNFQREDYLCCSS